MNREKRILYGADYYPEQWLQYPDILKEDLRLMKLAGVNVVTLGVFAWSALEPEEGRWEFGWLDEVMDRLYREGIAVILATPSGARPAWLAQRYPEVLRMNAERERNLYGMRMNHCFTSPQYRRLVGDADARLAQRYSRHPALIGWHISNEYHGECHCPLCQAAFRRFLKEKYGTLEHLNAAWWTTFWSKTYSDWQQIESPCPRGEQAVMGLTLDWKRFVTRQTGDFMNIEISAVRSASNAPVTTNMIGSFPEIDAPRLAPMLDIAALDVYPEWGRDRAWRIAMEAGFEYDVARSMKRRSFMLMETTPSRTNWTEVGKLKAPGLQAAGGIQALGHGADSVQFFQWRQSRGAFEKFHGAVIGHDGTENTRVFRETAALGAMLGKLDELAGAENGREAAILYDWNNRWALEGSKGPRQNKYYQEIVMEHYRALRRYGLTVDLVDEEQELDGYRLIAAPMLYLIKPGVTERLTAFAENGGILLLTFFSGIVDENDLCFQGGFPGPLRGLAGIWAEEMDTLYPNEHRKLHMRLGNRLDLQGSFPCDTYAETIHPEGADTEAVYESGEPVLTRNRVGKGEVWYLASRTEECFLRQFYGALLDRRELPENVELSVRRQGDTSYLFYVNWGETGVTLENVHGVDLLSGEEVSGKLFLGSLGMAVIKTI